ncbi:MAG TPA: outer membrane protein [Beijerinckiaceae bacterium]|jgi:opacity protein-like surface antigen
MRRLTIVCSVAVLGLSAPATAADMPPPPYEPAAPEGDLGIGWYLRGDLGYVGYAAPNDQPYGVPVPPLDNERLGNTWSVGGGVGYKVNGWFRADATLDYRGDSRFRATSSRTNYVEGFSTDRGELQSTTLMLNGYIDLGTWSGVTPYVGAGIGVARNEFHKYSGTVTCLLPTCGDTSGATYPLGPQAPTFIPARTTHELAWALMAGAAVDVAPGLKVDVGYRYVNIGQPHTKLDSFGVGTKLKDQEAHEVRLGLRWAFGGAGFPAAEPITAKY